MKNITQELIKELIHYDPDTGVFTWKERVNSSYMSDSRLIAFNSRCANKKITSISSHGYYRFALDGIRYYCHRVAWLYIYGEWPNKIDHIDRDKTNNRISNLRSVTSKENNRNQPIRKSNNSGCCGVCKVSDSRLWRAYITNNNKQVWLGSFKTFEDAVLARKLAEKEYGYHRNHGGKS